MEAQIPGFEAVRRHRRLYIMKGAPPPVTPCGHNPLSDFRFAKVPGSAGRLMPTYGARRLQDSRRRRALGALRSGCLLPDTLGLESEPILADFGTDTGFSSRVRTNIRLFRCRHWFFKWGRDQYPSFSVPSASRLSPATGRLRRAAPPSSGAALPVRATHRYRAARVPSARMPH